MQLCLTKLSVIMEIDPYVISLDFFNEGIIAATSNFQGMSAKNGSLLHIKEIVRIYANSKYMYLDRNVRWVHFIFAEYVLFYMLKYRLVIFGFEN